MQLLQCADPFPAPKTVLTPLCAVWQDDAVSQIPSTGGHRLGGRSLPALTESQSQRAPPSTPQRKPAPSSSSHSQKRAIDLMESDEEEIDDSGLQTPTSPSKRNKAHTFSERGKPKPSTPPPSDFAAIQADPDSPYHKIQANLFAAKPTPFATPSSPAGGTGVPNLIGSAMELLVQAQRTAEKDGRLLSGEKKGKEVVKSALDKAKGEISALRERVR